MANLICNLVGTALQWIELKSPLCYNARTVYSLVKEIHKDAVIGGEYPSHNIGWRRGYEIVSIYIGINSAREEAESLALSLQNILLQRLGTDMPCIRSIKFVGKKCLDENHKDQSARLYLENMKIEICFVDIPPLENDNWKHAKGLWDLFYLASYMPFQMSRVFITNIDGLHAQLICFGDSNSAIKELRVKEKICNAVWQEIQNFMDVKEQRLREVDLSPYQHRREIVIITMLNMRRYILSFDSDNIRRPTRLSSMTLHSLCYFGKESSPYVLPPCLRYWEQLVYRKTNLYKELTTMVNETVSLAFLQTMLDYKLPLLKRSKKCNGCQFGRCCYLT